MGPGNDPRGFLHRSGGSFPCETQVALSVPNDGECLDWELIVLDASRATQLGPSHVKLRRGDRILRVEEAGDDGSLWAVTA